MDATDLATTMTQTAEHTLELRIKVVPGSSRDRIAGLLGDRLKVAVSAPPEGGKANKAVCKLLASALGVPTRDVSVTAGHTQPQKTTTILGVTVDQAVAALTSN